MMLFIKRINCVEGHKLFTLFINIIMLERHLSDEKKKRWGGGGGGERDQKLTKKKNLPEVIIY